MGSRFMASVADHGQMDEKEHRHRDEFESWLTERDLIDHSIRDPWAVFVSDHGAGAAQQEYDSIPELRDLLTRAAASDSVIRSRRERRG